MKPVDIKQDLAGNSYPGRGIVIGQSADGKQAVVAYFIMGRSVNSRNRVFAEEPDGIRTEAADPAKMEDQMCIRDSPWPPWPLTARTTPLFWPARCWPSPMRIWPPSFSR